VVTYDLPCSYRTVWTCESDSVSVIENAYRRDVEFVLGRLVRVLAIVFVRDCVSELSDRPFSRRKLAVLRSA